MQEKQFKHYELRNLEDSPRWAARPIGYSEVGKRQFRHRATLRIGFSRGAGTGRFLGSPSKGTRPSLPHPGTGRVRLPINFGSAYRFTVPVKTNPKKTAQFSNGKPAAACTMSVRRVITCKP